MAVKLYVGSLAYSVNDQDLQELFAQAGTVESAKVIIDRDTDRSKGFGFVEMATEEEAQAAIKLFNDSEQQGRRLVVNKAKPMGDRPAHNNFRSRY